MTARNAARVSRSVEAVQIRQIGESDVDPIQTPPGEMIAPGAGSHVGHVEGDVEAFVNARQVALVTPQVETLAGDALVESSKGGHHIQLRLA